ncbi:hypothetical protein ACN20G_32365 (plasmid) [Streptomyces sp. BI20]|uniref:hypothetical protein n=1 Tax=Streptomyces sp. BI20 TaxID=3403460 RepID=UPI003C76BE6A
MKRPLLLCLSGGAALAVAGTATLLWAPWAGTPAPEPPDPRVRESFFARAADARAAATPPSAPAWVPEAAAEVRVRTRTDGPGTLLRFELPPGGRLPASCERVGPAGAPTGVDAPWWPAGKAGSADRECAGWRVAVEGSTVWAWHAAAPGADTPPPAPARSTTPG